MIPVLLTIVLLLVISSAWIFGVKCLFSPGFLFEPLDLACDEGKVPHWLLKPLWRCPPCMSSVHGSVIYFFFLYGDFGPILWLPFIVCLAGLNYFLIQLS